MSNSKFTTGFSIFSKKTFYKHACCWAARRHHIYQIYASYLHVRILYEFLGTFQSLKVFGKFKNKSKCFWKPSSKFTIRNGYLVTVYKSGFEACLWSTSCASALVLALKSWHRSSACAAVWTRVNRLRSGRHKLHFGPRAIRARDPRARYFPREIAI